MKSIRFDRTEAVCGLLFIVMGLAFAMQAYGLDLGSAFRMGPGYFPFLLSIILIILGGIIFIKAANFQSEPMSPIAWRGVIFILSAPIFFGLTVRGLGFVASIFITAMIASFASHKMKPSMAVILAFSLTVFCVLVFDYGLGLPFRRIGPWLWFLRS